MTTLMTQVDIFSPEFRRDPYPTYRLLRDEMPVYPSTSEKGLEMWLVTRYDDALTLLKDDRLIKNRMSLLPPEMVAALDIPDVVKPMMRNMLDLDAPDHTRLRALVHKAFTPALVERMRQQTQTIADELLDAVAARRSMNLMDDFAFPLPMTVISNILGIPAADRDRFRQWSNDIIDRELDDDMEAVVPIMSAFFGYLDVLFEARRRQPQPDLITALVEAEEAGDKLSQDELYAMVMLLIIAGHETTVNLIGNGTLALLCHPDQMALLRQNPGLARGAVEEMLRYDSPVQVATERYAREEMVFAGQHINQGDLMLAALGSANRDPQRFTDPDRFDITREDNRHLSFGQGIHYCIGAPLARMEAAIAFNTLLRRLPGLRLAVAPDELTYRPNMFLRGLTRLPVEW